MGAVSAPSAASAFRIRTNLPSDSLRRQSANSLGFHPFDHLIADTLPDRPTTKVAIREVNASVDSRPARLDRRRTEGIEVPDRAPDRQTGAVSERRAVAKEGSQDFC